MHGLTIFSRDGDLHIQEPQVVTQSKDIGRVNWISSALKATSINDVQKLITPCIHKNTNILVLMNGLGLEALSAGWFGKQNIFGVVAFTCIN
jgi:ketopantoate reductase